MRLSRALPALVAFALVAALACDADPVHSAQVDALGPEANGIPVGEYHRAGQPCTVCHGGEGPASTTFSIAGTVFFGPATMSPPIGVNDVTVYLQDDSPAQPYTVQTNCVGNFWVTASQWNPQFPVLVTIAGSPQGAYLTNSMMSHIGRDASCAGCHDYPANASSPGLIHLASMDDPSFMGDPECPASPEPPRLP